VEATSAAHFPVLLGVGVTFLRSLAGDMMVARVVVGSCYVTMGPGYLSCLYSDDFPETDISLV
jgi:hypothetical protein